MSYHYDDDYNRGPQQRELGGLGLYQTANGPGSVIGPGQESGLGTFWSGLSNNEKTFLMIVGAGVGLWLLLGGWKRFTKNPGRRRRRRRFRGKEDRMYKKIARSGRKRYGRRAKEVAARTVEKYRREHGETA